MRNTTSGSIRRKRFSPCKSDISEATGPPLVGGPVDGQPEKSGDHNELAGAGSYKDFWWSRGESNPCPKATWKELLRAQFVIYIPLSRREQTPYGMWELHNAWHAQSLAYARSPLKSHPSPARGPSGADGRLIRQPEQQCCCQLNLKVARFIVARRHGPLFQPHYPRRNQYGPMGASEGKSLPEAEKKNQNRP